MQLVETEAQNGPAYAGFEGTPLSVVFADTDAMQDVQRHGSGPLQLQPPYHVSDDDVYLVVPDDIGMELVDILRDGDRELLDEAMRDSLLVVGSASQATSGEVVLEVERTLSPADAFAAGLPYHATVHVGGGEEGSAEDPVDTINQLPHVQCTVLSSLLDDEGLDRMLRRDEYIGVSWHPGSSSSQGDSLLSALGGSEEGGGGTSSTSGVDPTYVWSRRLDTGRVGIELALFREYEELVVLLRPLVLEARG